MLPDVVFLVNKDYHCHNQRWGIALSKTGGGGNGVSLRPMTL